MSSDARAAVAVDVLFGEMKSEIKSYDKRIMVCRNVVAPFPSPSFTSHSIRNSCCPANVSAARRRLCCDPKTLLSLFEF